jgi:predicted nicotinamide N-methyase
MRGCDGHSDIDRRKPAQRRSGRANRPALAAVATRDPMLPVKRSLAAQCAGLRGVEPGELPPQLLDLVARRLELGGESVLYVRPADWEALREAEALARRPVPWWARTWPSGRALATALATGPSPAGLRVIELGCGLALPSIIAARRGAEVLATDGSTDAVAFAAHALALNGVLGDVAHADWAEHGEVLAAQGPFDLVLAADVLYKSANVEVALALLPALLAADGEVWLADPGRSGARDFLAAARARFSLETEHDGDVALHTLRPL